MFWDCHLSEHIPLDDHHNEKLFYNQWASIEFILLFLSFSFKKIFLLKILITIVKDNANELQKEKEKRKSAKTIEEQIRDREKYLKQWLPIITSTNLVICHHV